MSDLKPVRHAIDVMAKVEEGNYYVEIIRMLQAILEEKKRNPNNRFIFCQIKNLATATHSSVELKSADELNQTLINHYRCKLNDLNFEINRLRYTGIEQPHRTLNEPMTALSGE